MENNLSWEEFERVELRVGTILEVLEFPEAKRPAYKVIADFGPFGIKKSSAQITIAYKPDELIGKQIIGVLNFPKKQIGNYMSEFLVTGVENAEGAIVLSTLDKIVPNGNRLL